MSRAKRERQRALAESILAGQQSSQAGSEARAEPEPSFFDALVAYDAQRRLWRRDTVLGRTPLEASEQRVLSFDGGPRGRLPQPLPTHEETLLALLRSGEANVGANL
jgi:hypothetical protein